MTFAGTDIGKRMNVVSKLCCWDPEHESHLFHSLPGDQPFVVSGLLDGDGDIYTFMFASLTQHFPKPILVLDDHSRVFQHSRPSWSSMREVVELCSGFGGISQGMAAVGFNPVLAVDFNDRMLNLYRKQCAIETLVADITRVDTISKIWQLSRGASTLVGGYACQPFSNLGDQKGHLDGRSLSLRGILATAFYTQAQAIVLECVIPAAANSWVKTEIQKFVDATGFSCSQADFHLHDIWPSRRSRAWWLITAPWLGNISLPEWPKLHAAWKVSQVIPRIIA